MERNSREGEAPAEPKPLNDAAWNVFQDPLKHFETGRTMTKGAILFPKKVPQ